MHRRRYLAITGVALLAGCGSSDGGNGDGTGDGDGAPRGPSTSGPPTLAFGESYRTDGGVELTCDGVEAADALDIDGESYPPPDRLTWLFVDFRAENASDGERVLPWQQAFWVQLGDERFQHDVNDTPVEFLFWADGYTGGDPVEAGTVEEGVIPIAVDPDLVDRDATVMFRPLEMDLDTEVWWTGR